MSLNDGADSDNTDNVYGTQDTDVACTQNILRSNCPTRIISITDEELLQAYKKMMDASDPDSNNGLITKIWGEHAWEFNTAVCFNYPINPTEEDKKMYMEYFKAFANVLPCSLCCVSTNQFYEEDATKLTMDVMKSRETLTRWWHAMRDRVNKKLGVDYGVTYEEMCYKYESYRATCSKNSKGCTMPANMKAMSYQKAEIKRAPIIDEKYSRAFVEYAKALGFNGYENLLNKTVASKRNSKNWMIRDIRCVKTIKYMRKNGKTSLNADGMPTEDELMLLSMLSSNLGTDELDEVLRKINA
jgi:hypothetical protein